MDAMVKGISEIKTLTSGNFIVSLCLMIDTLEKSIKL